MRNTVKEALREFAAILIVISFGMYMGMKATNAGYVANVLAVVGFSIIYIIKLPEMKT